MKLAGCVRVLCGALLSAFIPDLLQIRNVPAVAPSSDDTDNIEMSRMSAGKRIVESCRTANQGLRLQSMHTYVHHH